MSNNVRDAIYAATPDPDVRRAMLLGALLEGGSWSGPWNAGDNGQSFGPFQIYSVAHPDVNRSQAENPDAAVAFMLPAYQAGVRRAGGASNAQQAATAVYYAERPLNMYNPSSYTSLWNQVANADSWQGGYSGGASGPQTTAPTETAQQVGVWQDLGNFGSMLFNPLGGAMNILPGVTGVGQAIGGLTGSVSTFFNMVSVLFKPSFWLRVGAFVAGAFLFGTGMFALMGAMK